MPYEEILTALINGVNQIKCSRRAAYSFLEVLKKEKTEYERKIGEQDNQLEQGIYTVHLNQKMKEWLLNETQQLGSGIEYWLRIKNKIVSNIPRQF